MQIVIKIPNEAYNEIVNNVSASHRKFSTYEMDNCIKNGTPLPKVHEMREAAPEELEASITILNQSVERDEKINKAMDLLSEHDYVSWYQEAVNIVFNYIDYLETELEVYNKAKKRGTNKIETLLEEMYG